MMLMVASIGASRPADLEPQMLVSVIEDSQRQLYTLSENGETFTPYIKGYHIVPDVYLAWNLPWLIFSSYEGMRVNYYRRHIGDGHIEFVAHNVQVVDEPLINPRVGAWDIVEWFDTKAVQTDLYKRHRSSGEMIQLTDTAENERYFGARDGWLYYMRTSFSTGSDLWRVHLDQRISQQLTDTPELNERLLSISPDGKWLIFSRGQIQSLYRMRVDGSETAPLTQVNEWHQDFVTWTPDGNAIIYKTWQAGTGTPIYYRIGLDGEGFLNYSQRHPQITGWLDWVPDVTQPWHPLALAVVTCALFILVGAIEVSALQRRQAGQ